MIEEEQEVKRTLGNSDICPDCGTNFQNEPSKGVICHEYKGTPEDYDGVSEYICPECGYREGVWTGQELKEGFIEPRHGEGGHPVQFPIIEEE